jgi:DMSO/TMAO reductase YedYZ heme-binding membrane subunit
LLIVTGSFWVRQWTGQKLWRAIHYLSFVICLLVGLHALWAGTDTEVLRYGYLVTTLVVVFLTIFRIVSAFDRPPTRPAGSA